MSNESRESGSSTESSQISVDSKNKPEIKPTATNERSSSRITWKGNVKGPADTREGAEPIGSQRPAELGGYSKSTLSPLTPLTKAPEEYLQQPKYDQRPVGFAYSSPNLKALNNFSNYEQAKLMESYLSGTQGGGGRGNGNYVDPLYRHLNPLMGGAKNRPVWSLNQPLPHVLNQSLAEKMIQKNAEARSRASSRSGSRDVSRSGSMTSINDWKRLLRRTTSNAKPNDIEAQIPNAGASKTSLKRPRENNEKPSHSQIEFAQNKENASKAGHNARFSLGGDSYASSIANEEPPLIKKAQSNNTPASIHADLLKERLDEAAKNAGVSDGGDGGFAGDEDSEEVAFPNYWAKIRYRLREPFAEFLGTLVLVIFGVGGNLQATVTDGSGGSYESLSFAWGFGCMLGVYVAGGISGGHINPAVTISMAIFRKFPWKKVPVYIFAQIVGAFFGGAMAYGYFWSSITKYEGGAHIRTAATGACLFTNPKSYVTWRNAFFDEFIGAAMLVGCLMALLDDSNAPPANGSTAVIVGLLVAAIGMALGYQTSFTINPARDLGPRIFASMIGYGPHAFHLTHWWWAWGGWGGPIAGGITGALVYDLFVFTGCESPINYPDNGYIEHRVQKLLHAEVNGSTNTVSPDTEMDENSYSNASAKK